MIVCASLATDIWTVLNIAATFAVAGVPSEDISTFDIVS